MNDKIVSGNSIYCSRGYCSIGPNRRVSERKRDRVDRNVDRETEIMIDNVLRDKPPPRKKKKTIF
jgi:hypothetical protein